MLSFFLYLSSLKKIGKIIFTIGLLIVVKNNVAKFFPKPYIPDISAPKNDIKKINQPVKYSIFFNRIPFIKMYNFFIIF